MRPGVVYFIGAGPGDPELLTVKGRRLIETADLVVWADSLVHPGVAALARADAELLGSSSLTLEQITDTLVSASRAGKKIARVQSGDPSLYGAIHEQQVLLEREQVSYEIVPGVSSAFAAAARITKQALILVGRAIDPALRQRAAAASRSHLYRPDYTHLFRRGAPT